MFKPGQKIVRQKDRQEPWQKENWESKAKFFKFNPYCPVEVLTVDWDSSNIYIKEVGGSSCFHAHLFEPAGPNSNLEDWL